MSLASALVLFVFGLISKEAPNVRTDQELSARYMVDISDLVELHDEVSTGQLVSHDMDVLILTAVNYRESRLKNPSVDGDCHMEHALQNQPSATWPKGYKPKYTQRCNAVGPMQLAKDHAGNLSTWPEVVAKFDGVRWQADDPLTIKAGKFKPDDLRDPKTNIQVAYAELEHWKNECRGKDKAEAPIGVWLTAYRYGHCPPIGKASGRFYIDKEAGIRCDLVKTMVTALTADSAGLETPRCTY